MMPGCPHLGHATCTHASTSGIAASLSGVTSLSNTREYSTSRCSNRVCNLRSSAGLPCRPSVPITRPHRLQVRARSIALRRTARIPAWSYSSRVSTRPYGSYLRHEGVLFTSARRSVAQHDVRFNGATPRPLRHCMHAGQVDDLANTRALSYGPALVCRQRRIRNHERL